MDNKTIKATLTQGKDKRLTLRLFLNEQDKELFILQNGEQPEGMIKMVVV